jgi:hypothetical protein
MPYQWNADPNAGHLGHPAAQGGHPSQPDDRLEID